MIGVVIFVYILSSGVRIYHHLFEPLSSPLHETFEHNRTMSEEKKARSIAKAQFTRAEGHLLQALNDGKDRWAIERRYDDLKVRWNKTQDAHDGYVLTLANDDDAVKEAIWIDEIADRFSKIELSVSKMFDAPKQCEEKTRPERVDDTKATIQQCGVKIERMKLAVFKGDIRKYPEFKREFIKYIQPQCQTEELPFVLKGYLDEIVKEEVNNVGDVYAEMWKRLDMKYGNIGKLVDPILSDVKKLSPNNSHPSEVLKMINTVEKAWRDLKALGQANELCNSTTISIIEQAMSQQMKNEWIKLIASKAFDSGKKFLSLLEFVRDWRCRIEYALAEIREEEALHQSSQHAPVHQVTGRRNSAAGRGAGFIILMGRPENTQYGNVDCFKASQLARGRILSVLTMPASGAW